MRRIFIFFTSILTLLAFLIMIFYKTLLAFFVVILGLFVSALIYVFPLEHRIQGLLPILAPNPIYENLPRTLRPPA